MAASVTATQRFSDAGHANWKCFPAPYVMPPERQRSSSRSRKRNRTQNLSDSYEAPSLHWQQEPFQRPATALPAISHNSPDTIRRTRSRTKLQKRPSQRAVRKSASASIISPPFAQSQDLILNQPDITALPQVPDGGLTERRASLRKMPSTGIADRRGSQQGPLEQPRPTPMTTHGLLSLRLKTSSSEKNTTTDSELARSPSPGRVPSPTIPPRTPRYQELAPYDPSPLNPRYHIPPSSFSNGGTESAPPASDRNGHVLSPATFKPGKTEHTYVEALVVPGVTHEVIKHSKTEIIQEEVTREIHVHHYYRYTQPIKAVEVLPARHFIVDTQTGEKVEIPPPEGWVMPSHLQPHKSDTSGRGLAAQHSPVDEDHTSGVLGPPQPSGKKRVSHPELRKKTSMTGSWTPFPRVR